MCEVGEQPSLLPSDENALKFGKGIVREIPASVEGAGLHAELTTTNGAAELEGHILITQVHDICPRMGLHKNTS